jgi:endoglucanase
MNLRSFFVGVVLAWSTAVRAQPAEFTPANPPEMKPLAGRESPAHKAAANFRHGVNLANYLEVPPGRNWSVKITAEDFARIKAEGFDHIRVPIGWHHYAGPAPDFKLADAIFDKVDFVLTNALAQHLAVMLNIQHFNEFTSNPPAYTAEFIALWRQIAAHYAKLPDTVAFELLNEPKDAATTAVMNPIYARAIAAVRETNPRRTIVVGPGRWNSIDELKNLVLPAGDDNLIVTVHCYDPFYFTHQGASWAGPDVKTRGIIFPGPPKTPLEPDPSVKRYVIDWINRYNTLPADKNPSSRAAFESKLKLARQWSDHYGRPVHVGEFGCYTTADPESRANFYREFRKVLDEQKLGWAIWDWNAGFHYWDPRKNEPAHGMREALFGKK